MQTSFKLLCLLALLLSALTSHSQLDICGENEIGVFFPIKIGVKRHYYTQSGPYVSYFNGDSLKVGENIYYKEIKDYGSGETKMVYYREKDGNVFIYDTDKKLEFLEVSNNVTPGYTWEKYDKSWRYTVIDTTKSLSTPYCEYKSLLNIKAEPLGKTKNDYASYFNLYYKRGVGLVGLDVAGKGYSFLTIDKSIVNEKSYVALGCENLIEDDKRLQCTSAKVNEFISKRFNYLGKVKKGIITIRFIITENGEVENVSVLQTIKNAEGQTNEAIRIIKLMKFIPRQVNDRPYKSFVIIPIDFEHF